MASEVPISYSYSPLRDVGALPAPANQWNGPTSPLHFELADHFLKDRLNNPEYIAAKGEWFWQQLHEEAESNILNNYQDSIGIATNLFQLRNVFHDDEQAAIASVKVEGNSVRKNYRGTDPAFFYDFFPFDDSEKVDLRRQKLFAAVMRRSSTLPIDTGVSFQTSLPRQIPREGADSRTEDRPYMATGAIRLDLDATIKRLGSVAGAELSPEELAQELNRMLCVGIVGVALQNAAHARRYIRLGGVEAVHQRVSETLSADKEASTDAIEKAAGRNGSRAEQRKAYDLYRQREASAQKIRTILERGPIINALEK